MTRYYVKKFVRRSVEKKSSRKSQEEASQGIVSETEVKDKEIETPSDEQSVEKKDKPFKKKKAIDTKKGE